MDHGIVGGSLKNQEAETQAVGRLALRVLNGEAADSIPVSSRDLNVSQVDWRQLRRWGIDEARVPSATLVRFREPTIWDRYKVYILVALGLLLTQTALITGLLIHRARTQRAENELRRSQVELRTSYQRIRDLGGRLLHAQETERSRIARELHDDISQRLSLLVIDLVLLRGTVDTQAKGMTDEAVNRVEDLVKSVHDLSHRLHPAKLRLIGLVAALRDLQHEMSQGPVPITFTHDNVPPTLPLDVTLCMFRIVQEALQNALKHSHATEVGVHLSGSATALMLTIVDNGVGFDVEAAWGKGLGLISMSERLEAIGGIFEINSNPGTGTRLNVKVPLPMALDTEPVAV
jgi:signal transduction histidine kinase